MSKDERSPVIRLSNTSSITHISLLFNGRQLTMMACSAVTIETQPSLPYDVCFGLVGASPAKRLVKTCAKLWKLLMEASCHHKELDPPSSFTPVQITCLENAMMLRYEGSGTCAGVLVSQALPKLVKEHAVTLAGSLGAHKGPHFALLDKFKRTRDDIRVRVLRIIVYGLRTSKNAVKTILDQHDLFLQRPEDFEYDRRVRYLNPMYFTRPGEEFPRLLNLSATRSQRPTPMDFNEEALGETKTNRVLRIFDEAGAIKSNVAPEIKQSSRIISTLKESVWYLVAKMTFRS